MTKTVKICMLIFFDKMIKKWWQNHNKDI